MVLQPTLPDEIVSPPIEEDETFLTPTIQVKIHGPSGSGTVRGLVTWTSTYSLLTEKAFRMFNFPLHNAVVPTITSVTGTVMEVVGLSRIRISPHYDDTDITTVDVVVVKDVFQRVTTTTVHPIIRINLSNVQLADPLFDVPGEIDMVFGAATTPDLMKCGNIRVYGSICHAMETSMGWIVLGRAPVQEDPEEMFELD